MTEERSLRLRHDVSQPLNVIGIATANIRHRLSPVLSSEDVDYLTRKIERIEAQLDKIRGLLATVGDPI